MLMLVRSLSTDEEESDGVDPDLMLDICRVPLKPVLGMLERVSSN